MLLDLTLNYYKKSGCVQPQIAAYFSRHFVFIANFAKSKSDSDV